MTAIAPRPLPVAPAPGGDLALCRYDGRTARYAVDVAVGDGGGAGRPVRRSYLCLGCWLDRSGTIAGLVGARRLR